MLRLEHLSCGYGALRAVEDLSFEVAAGALAGAARSQRRRQDLDDHGHHGPHHHQQRQNPVRGQRHHSHEPAVKRAPLGIALVPEGRRLFADLTVEENLTVGGYSRARRATPANRERVYDLFPRLRDRSEAGGRFDVGRRAADAGDRPGAHGRTEAAAHR